MTRGAFGPARRGASSSLAGLCTAACLLASGCASPPRAPAGLASVAPTAGRSGTYGAEGAGASLLPGAVTSAPGAPFPWQYLYDRNGLLTSMAVGVYRVAIAEAGHVLVFDHDHHLAGELLLRTSATCLGAAAPSHVLVGYADGTIERVAIPGLTRQALARGPARVQWIGATPGSSRSIAVFAGVGDESQPAPATAHRAASAYTVRVLDSGADIRVLPASTFLLDAAGQLWLGAEHGHRGGTLQSVQLDSARVTTLESPVGSGVYGFAQVGDEVWAYGGTVHLGVLLAEITRVWPGEPKLLYSHESDAISQRIDLKQRPTVPIRQLVSTGDRVLVIASNDLFESDRSLAHWTWRERLVAPSNRPDGGGNDLVIRAADIAGDRMLLTTERDGLIEHTQGSSMSHALPGQLPLAPNDVLVSQDASLLLRGAGHEPYVMPKDDGWAPAQTFLPPVPDTSADPQASSWCATEFFPHADGSIGFIARRGPPENGGYCADGTNDLVLSGSWDRGHFRERHRELTTMNPARAFALPDGTPAVQTADRVLWTLEAGGFHRHDGSSPLEGPTSLGRYGSGWLLLNRGHVLRLELSASRDLLLESVGDLHGGFDALRLSESELLFVDQRGVWVFELTTRRRRPLVGHPIPDRIDAIETDGRGRVWGLGEQLYVLHAGGMATPLALPFARPLPPEHWSYERRLAIGGSQILVPLSDRGLLVIDADAAAAAVERRPQIKYPDRPPHTLAQ